MSITLPVSIGEALDKLTILEIKQSLISEPDRKNSVIGEIQCLKPLLLKHINENQRYYYFLKWVNEIIWHLSDQVRVMTTNDSNYNQMMFEIFTANEARFRLKKILNTKSVLQEQKNYATKTCTIFMPEDTKTVLQLLGVLQWMTTEYDLVNILTTPQIEAVLQNWVGDNPSLKMIKSSSENTINNETTSNNIFDWKQLNEDTPDFIKKLNVPEKVFCNPLFWAKWKQETSETVNYLMGGCLGDLIHTLYVILINYLNTGKKGILYITNNTAHGGDLFRTGVQKTYKDTYDVIKSQYYIHDYFIFDDNASIGTNYFQCVNLNIWRPTPYGLKYEWNKLLGATYGFDKLPVSWLNIPVNHKYENHIIIHHVTYRYTDSSLHEKIVNNNKCYFLTCNINEYNDYPYKKQVELILCDNLMELAIVISSCRFFIGSQSSPLAFAFSMRKPCLCELDCPRFYLGNVFNNTDVFWISKTDKYMNGIEKYIKL